MKIKTAFIKDREYLLKTDILRKNNPELFKIKIIDSGKLTIRKRKVSKEYRVAFCDGFR